MTGKQRAALRKKASGLTPVFQVGKGGVDGNLLDATAKCLAARELVKLRVLETSPEEPREAAQRLAEGTGSTLVHVMGRTLVLFKQKPKESAYDWVFG